MKDRTMSNAERFLFAIIGAAAGMVPLVFVGAMLIPYIDNPPFFIIPLLPTTGAALGWRFASRIDEWLKAST